MKNRVKLILASGSPRRKEILMNMGYDPVVIKSEADEASEETRPDKLVEELSRRKCLDVAGKIISGEIKGCGNSVVLGADTVVSLDGDILGKPAERDEAFEMLSALSGKMHQVYTGVTIAHIRNEEEKDSRNITISSAETFSVRTDVYVSEMTDDEIEEYISTGEPFDKAGGYGIQGIFGKFIYKIDGDYYNVVGLPAAEVYRNLKMMTAEK